MRLRYLVAVAAPPAVVAAWAVARSSVGDSGDGARGWIALAVALAFSGALAWSVTTRHRRRLGTVSSVLSAYREGDYSIRARADRDDGAVSEVLSELNQLGDLLRTHRLGELEAWALLHKVLAEVDVVVIAIDEHDTVRLANDAAARVLGRPSRELVGAKGAELGLGGLSTGEVPRVLDVPLDAGTGPWELRRGTFRLAGEPQTLFVLSDVSRALRENEREAWQKIIRVMGHEINNSLSPIRSISESLLAFTDPGKREADWERDLEAGLSVIARRSEALGRFVGSYAKLARLPPPQLADVSVSNLAGKVATLEKRVTVRVVGGPEVTLRADPDQIEQALINLVKNGAEASLLRGAGGPAGVRLWWEVEGSSLALSVEDDGPGVDDTANLFVPFFTTKPDGSGVGLVLSRQIIEAHHGQLSLSSRAGRAGAVARVCLPIERPG